MTFQELVAYQHTRLSIPEINEKKIRKVFDELAKPPEKVAKKGKAARDGTPASARVTLASTGTTLDIIYCFEPLEPKPKSKNAAFTIDGARALQEMVTGVFASQKSTIIVLAYAKYGEEAQNALLKTLEESPSNVYICVLYTPETIIIPTIASRSFDLFASSPFADKTTVDDFRQKMTPNQIIRMQKLLAKAGNLPDSWITDFKKAVKSSK